MGSERLLLISNGSELVGDHPSERAQAALKDFLGEGVRRLLLISYASVIRTYDECAALARAEALVIHGGNTFHLLAGLYENNLIEAIQARVAAGMPYVGWSAGANVACPTIRTTNDMPVVEPPSLKALALVPFQINPHYTDRSLEGHHGETRDERIAEFVHLNPGVYVVGLREGAMLRVEGSAVKLLGSGPARIFLRGKMPDEVGPETSLDFLLR